MRKNGSQSVKIVLLINQFVQMKKRVYFSFPCLLMEENNM